mmetsp:Transcript_42560/g.92483  ORF Transcript_42560/g.92483 Transcript_42560/m.92483 type:complete len:89 (-) Transcript_42560:172-438(-)
MFGHSVWMSWTGILMAHLHGDWSQQQLLGAPAAILRLRLQGNPAVYGSLEGVDRTEEHWQMSGEALTLHLGSRSKQQLPGDRELEQQL